MKCTSTTGALWMRMSGILVEVLLLHSAVLDRDLESEHRRQAVHDRALALVLGAAEVDDGAHVGGHGDLVHRQLFVVVDADVGDLGDVAGVAEVEREAEGVSLGLGLAPAGLVGGELDDASRRGRC